MIKTLETSELKSVVGGASAEEYQVIPIVAVMLRDLESPQLMGDFVRDLVQG